MVSTKVVAMTRTKRWAWTVGITAGVIVATMGTTMASSWYAYDMMVPNFGGSVDSSQTRTMEHAPTAYVNETYASGGGTIYYAVAYEDGSQLTPWYAVNPGQTVDVTGSSTYLKDGYPVKLTAKSPVYYGTYTNVQGSWNP